MKHNPKEKVESILVDVKVKDSREKLSQIRSDKNSNLGICNYPYEEFESTQRDAILRYLKGGLVLVRSYKNLNIEIQYNPLEEDESILVGAKAQAAKENLSQVRLD